MVVRNSSLSITTIFLVHTAKSAARDGAADFIVAGEPGRLTGRRRRIRGVIS